MSENTNFSVLVTIRVGTQLIEITPQEAKNLYRYLNHTFRMSEPIENIAISKIELQIHDKIIVLTPNEISELKDILSNIVKTEVEQRDMNRDNIPTDLEDIYRKYAQKYGTRFPYEYQVWCHAK
jgi:hypothetical protein